MITRHRFLHKYKIRPTSEKLILGTIHPHDHEKFETDFFYGNENSIWNILSDAFPAELKKPIELSKILSFLKGRKISMSDTIKECKRKNNSALDQDLVPTELNYELKEQLEGSNIKEILFTSGFGKNNSFKLFYNDILGLSIPSEFKKNRGGILPKNVLGYEIKLTVLYSPARTANRGIANSKLYKENKERFQNQSSPVQSFKVWYYKKMFSK